MTSVETAAGTAGHRPGARPAWRIVVEPRMGGWWQILFEVRGKPRRPLFVPRWFPEDTARSMAAEVRQVVEDALQAVAQGEA